MQGFLQPAEALCAVRSKQMASGEGPCASDEKANSLQDLPPHVLVRPSCVCVFANTACGVCAAPHSLAGKRWRT